MKPPSITTLAPLFIHWDMCCLTCSWAWAHSGAQISKGHTRQLYWCLYWLHWAVPAYRANLLCCWASCSLLWEAWFHMFAVGPLPLPLGWGIHCMLFFWGKLVCAWQEEAGFVLQPVSWFSHPFAVNLPTTKCHPSVLLVGDLLWDNLLWNKLLFTKEIWGPHPCLHCLFLINLRVLMWMLLVVHDLSHKEEL